jgi:excisionase family DNA binding protein
MEAQVYTITEMQEMLNISRESAYRFAGEVYQKQEPFVILKIGRSFRIPKDSFDRWMKGQTGELQE